MKNIFLLLVTFLLFSASVFSQSNLQNLVQQGISKTYNMDFDEAEKIYNKVIDQFPEQPQGFYRIAQIHFWIFLGTRDPGEYYVFLKFADLAQQKIDKILDADDKNDRINYMAGNLATFKAMAYATNNSTVDAIWASKKAVDYFETTLDINSKYYDAYLGLGLFDYAMSFVPDFLRWAVNLTGLTSDKDRGLRYIKRAFNRGNDKIDAAFHLSKIYTDYLADYDSAYVYLDYLMDRFPNNTLFNYQYAVTLIKDHKLDKANDYLNKVIRLNNTKIPQITALAYYRKGEILFKKNQFKDALKQYDKFLNSTKEFSFNGIAAFNSAICYKILGDDAGYEKYIAMAGDGNKDVYDDAYAKVKAEEFMKSGISPLDIKLIKLKNNLESGKYKSVYDSLKSSEEIFQKPERLAIALTLFSEASLALKKYADVENTTSEIQSMDLDSEKWTLPNSYLLRAIANFAVGEKATARKFLDEAGSSNDFDFKDQIQSRIESLKRKLAKN